MFKRLKSSLNRRLAAVLVCCVSLVLVLPGCGPDLLTRTVSALEKGVQALQNAPDAYKDVLRATIVDLNGGLKDALDQAQAFTDHILTESEQMTFCLGDYFGKRALEGLEQILYNVSPDKHPAPTITPTVCRTNPSDQVTAGLTDKVVFSGYDLPSFGAPSRQDTPYTASLYYGNTEAIKNFGSVSVPTNYEVVVAFQPNTTKALDSSRNPRLVLQWSGGKIDSDGGSVSLPVVFPKTWVLHEEVSYHVRDQIWPTRVCERLHNSVNNDYWSVPVPDALHWKVDLSKGDPGHSGIILTKDDSNSVAKEFSSDWGYFVVDDKEVRFNGTVCAAPLLKGGGIYDRYYDIYLVER